MSRLTDSEEQVSIQKNKKTKKQKNKKTKKQKKNKKQKNRNIIPWDIIPLKSHTHIGCGFFAYPYNNVIRVRSANDMVKINLNFSYK